MAITTGQISIVDYNDALTLTGFISSNHPKTQQYNPDNDTFNPDWSQKNLVLTASLFKLGSSNDIIDDPQVQSIKWFRGDSPDVEITSGNAGFTVSGKILTVTENKLATRSAMDFVCEITYRDSVTGLDLSYKMSISFAKVENGGGIVSTVAWAPEGNIFKNGRSGSLTLEADLWRGGTADTTNVSYRWYKQDPSVGTDQGGGAGWEKLTSSANDGETGYNTREITVPADAVPSFEVYKIVITDTDTSSSTNGKSFQDTVTVLDQSDPVQVSIVAPGGSVFKNGQGSTELTAKLFRSGEEIDPGGTTYTYKWYKYDKEGVLETGFGGSNNYQTGKSITVGSADVATKATFICEVE